MRRLIATAMVALGLAGVAGATTGPTLRLVKTKPFVVKGNHFEARERVLVALRTDKTRLLRHTRTTSIGTMSVDFGTVTFDRCSGFTIRATGSQGSVAVLRHPPLPACIPERSP